MKIAIVIPCYKVHEFILKVISEIPSSVDFIYVVDDACPENSGDLVAAHGVDPRVKVLRHKVNQGVGAAMMTGYDQALSDGAEIIVKIDGDGQMDISLLERIVAPIVRGEADYVKGNRFYNLQQIWRMPKIRILGNAILSFFAKSSSGYYTVFDPNNGFTGISRYALQQINFSQINKRYFFETDMLFQLNCARGVVLDVPMPARYGNEISNLKIHKILLPFLFNNFRNFWKRIFYTYYLRDFNLGSIELPMGFFSLSFGLLDGMTNWYDSSRSGIPTPMGAQFVVAICVLVGVQLLLSFFNFDVGNTPNRPISPRPKD